MARSERQKLKLLYIKDLLEQQSDETHPLSTQAIVDALARQGIQAERKSVYDDIACLQQYGMDIVCIRGPGGGYFLASRPFELPELKLLVDAVQSSRFLTEKKSMQLIAKLGTLASREQAGSLRRQVVVSGRVKTMNESIYYSVDLLHEAIARNSQITFRYFDWNLDGSRHYRPGKYTASPYALCWQDENYYLIAHSERHGLTHYRVDKMAQISITDKPRYMDAQMRSIDLSEYGKNVFGMFGGAREQVHLRFDRTLTGVVVDRFGRQTLLIPDGPDAFTCTVDVAVSPNFFGWLASFGRRAAVLGPAHVRESYLALCREAAEASAACAEDG